jgi:hypothetical protein
MGSVPAASAVDPVAFDRATKSRRETLESVMGGKMQRRKRAGHARHGDTPTGTRGRLR